VSSARVGPLFGRLARGSAAALLCAACIGAHAAAEAIDGLGALDFPTSTKSPAAQTAFVRGMLLLHVYEYPRAEKAFQEAEKLDPGFAMAYWGEAMTATHPLWNQDNPAAGRAALAKLAPTPEARAAKAATPREKAWLGAVDALFADKPLAERDRGFLDAMEAIAKANPDDDEAQLFLAQALLGVTRGNRNVDNYLRAADISTRVLAHNPQHPGAAHYWIHGMDDPEHAAGALPAARVLAKIAPDAGHAQHMVSHIFIALGMWDDVVEANEHSFALTVKQDRAAGKPPLGCGHYPEWLEYGYYQLGRPGVARKMVDDCERDTPVVMAWLAAHPGEHIHMEKTPEALKRYLDVERIAMRGTMLIETATPKSAIPPPLADADGAGRALGMDAFSVGYAAALAGNTDVARAQMQRMRAIAAQPAPTTEILLHLTDYLGVGADLLDAMIEHRAGRHAQAQTLAARAAANSDALPFAFGPPFLFKPPHELAGELLLADRQPKAAVAEFDLALKTAPKRAASLLGRARALKASGARAEAKAAYAELAAIWKNAEPDQPALAEVRREAGGAAKAHSAPP
jgi:tetratricopeptide (TPR) repeat protein